MNRLWLAVIFLLAVLLGAVGPRISGRSPRVTPGWGEIGILTICTGWFLGTLLFGTVLQEPTIGVLILVLTLLGISGVLIGLHVGWSASRSMKRWVTYLVAIGAAAILLFA